VGDVDIALAGVVLLGVVVSSTSAEEPGEGADAVTAAIAPAAGCA